MNASMNSKNMKYLWISLISLKYYLKKYRKISMVQTIIILLSVGGTILLRFSLIYIKSVLSQYCLNKFNCS